MSLLEVAAKNSVRFVFYLARRFAPAEYSLGLDDFYFPERPRPLSSRPQGWQRAVANLLDFRRGLRQNLFQRLGALGDHE